MCLPRILLLADRKSEHITRSLLGVLKMRNIVTLVFLMTLLEVSVHAQQPNQTFQIEDPAREVPVPAELLYFNEVQESAGTQVAPPARFAIPKLDEPTTPPGLTQSRRQQEAQVIYPENSFVSNSPIKQVSVLSHQQLYHRPSVQQNNPTATSSGAWHSVSPKRKFFFGIDPASCCDEWAGMCGCGGLTANSGHGGPAQGADSCEERCFQRKRGPLPSSKMRLWRAEL